MQYELSYSTFQQVPYMSGTVQNISEKAPVEVCDSETPNSGLVLYPGEKYEWTDTTIYIRAFWNTPDEVIASALPLSGSGGGGGGGGDTPDASPTTKGKMKLYNTTGTNIDGTMTQRSITEAIEEVDRPVIEISLSLAVAGWEKVAEDGYMYRCTLSDAKIKADLMPSITFDLTSLDEAIKSQIAPVCDTVAGKVYIYAASAPTKVITGKLRLLEVEA